MSDYSTNIRESADITTVIALEDVWVIEAANDAAHVISRRSVVRRRDIASVS